MENRGIMKRIIVEGVFPVERVLARILPDVLEVADEKGREPRTFSIRVVDLEHGRRQNEHLEFQGCSDLIGLTFQSAESTVLNMEHIPFAAGNVRFLQMPFQFSELRSAIEEFPAGSVRLLGHAGVNLLWHFKELVTAAHPNDLLEKAIKHKIKTDYSDFAGQMERPGLLFENLAARVLLSFYQGLAHSREEGLEALTMALARTHANGASPSVFRTRMALFLDKTRNFREDLKRQEHYFECLAEAQTALGVQEASDITLFHPLHRSVNKQLRQLASVGTALLENRCSREEVFQTTLNAARALGNLLEQRDMLKRRIKR